jgi:hypothetical protein
MVFKARRVCNILFDYNEYEEMREFSHKHGYSINQIVRAAVSNFTGLTDKQKKIDIQEYDEVFRE